MAMSKIDSSNLSQKMLEQIAKYRKDAKYTDVVIETLDKDIFAHKVILASVNWTILTMLDKQRITLKDYKGVDLEKIINYLYSGKIDIHQTTEAIHLCDIANKLHFQYLVDFIIENLMEKTNNLADCINIWRFAKKQNFTKLKKACEKKIYSDLKEFMIYSIEDLSVQEINFLLKPSNISDFDKVKIIIQWGSLLENSMERRTDVERLFCEFVDWTKIESDHIPYISLHPYMSKNFPELIIQELMNPRMQSLKSPRIDGTKLKKQKLEWDSYSE